MALTTQTPPPRALQSKPRRVHLVLRDGAEVEGGIFLNDGQALAPYLSSRKGGWVNLVNAQWILPVEEMANHAVIQADHVLYAYGPDGDVPVHAVAGAMAVRHVELTLTTDARIRGQLNIADRQRLSDFLHTVGKFIPIVNVHRADNDVKVGDIALNHAAVRVLRDTAPAGRATTALDARGTAAMRAADIDARMTPPMGMPMEPPARRPTASVGLGGLPPEARRETPPTGAKAQPADDVRTETIAVEGASYTLEVPGPPVDRRSGSRTAVRARITLNLEGDSPVEVTQEAVDEPESAFSADVAARAEKVATHWLALVAQRFGLQPADARRLPDAFSLEQLWDGIARANDVTADEFAVHVASTFRLPVARLDRIEARAVQLLDEAVARRHGAIPVRADDKALVVAVSDPTSLELEQALRAATRLAVSFELAPPKAIRGAQEWWYRGEMRASTAIPVAKE